MSEPVVAVVVAAGLGVRYGGTRPKPLLRVGRRPAVALAMEALAAAGCTHIVLVTGPRAPARLLEAASGAAVPVLTTTGGSNRQESVRRGLEVVRTHPDLAGARVVLVHDAVRPLQPPEVIARVIEAVAGGAVAVAPVLEVTDSIRILDGDGSRPIDRAGLRAVQTPQGFSLAVLLASHDLAAGTGEFTDDLTCCEQAGHPVSLVPGSRLGLKITEPVDLVVARALWRHREHLSKEQP